MGRAGRSLRQVGCTYYSRGASICALGGWARMMGRDPKPDDLLIPSREGVNRSVNQAYKRLHTDLTRLELRERRIHDTRRTFISLCLGDGARKDVLRWVTHGSTGDIMDLYTTLSWSSLCEAVACLKIERLEGKLIAIPRAAVAGVGTDLLSEGGSAIFFVSNNRTGTITITDSITRNNPRGTFETPNLPGFYVLAKDPANIVNSQILR